MPFAVDLAGLAPASSGTNTDMLLYTPQAQVHKRIVTEKAPLKRDSLCGTLFWSVVQTYQCYEPIISNSCTKSQVFVHRF